MKRGTFKHPGHRKRSIASKIFKLGSRLENKLNLTNLRKGNKGEKMMEIAIINQDSGNKFKAYQKLKSSIVILTQESVLFIIDAQDIKYSEWKRITHNTKKTYI